MCSRFSRRFMRAVPAAALIATGVLAGCADSDSSRPSSGDASNGTVDEIAAHDGRTCPKGLPHETHADHGLGTDVPAESAPSLATPESAWVCRYDPTSAGSVPDEGGTALAWVRAGRARRVASADLPVLARDLTELAPVNERRSCTDDLGSRWMLVYSHGSDLTGVVVDDFGCREVRLTDEPFETAPGDADQAGTVPGVLTAPDGFLDNLKELHHP